MDAPPYGEEHYETPDWVLDEKLRREAQRHQEVIEARIEEKLELRRLQEEAQELGSHGF